MNNFEGYVGIKIGQEQWADDLIFFLLLLHFVAFAFTFRRYYPVFYKMIKDVFLLKKRQSLFEDPISDEKTFRRFMIFHALSLCSTSLFIAGYKSNYFIINNLLEAIIAFCLILLVFFVFYQLKQFFYYLIAVVFFEKEDYELWKTGYYAIISILGVALYLPIIWLILVEKTIIYPLICLSVFYILSRFAIIYKTTRIFSPKRDGILYLSLYLCAQEIMPLYLLFVGMDYLYNFIEMNTLWR